MIRRPAFAALLIIGALVLAACGSGNKSSSGSATRTVKVDMVDIAYKPSSVTVKEGETVKFVFTNKGKVRHDAFVGDQAAQESHEMEMHSGSTMNDMDHGGGHMGGEGGITVEPGKTGELTHTFQANEHVLIGCHEEGHFAAGMKLTVDVTPKGQ